MRNDDLLAFLRERSLPVPIVLGGAHSVLLAGLDEGVARSLQRRVPDLDVHVASDLIDALLQLGACRPETLVLDVDREDMVDPELVARIRAKPLTANVLIVVLGSFTPAHDRVGAFHRAGALACLPKPLELDTLIATLGFGHDV